MWSATWWYRGSLTALHLCSNLGSWHCTFFAWSDGGLRAYPRVVWKAFQDNSWGWVLPVYFLASWQNISTLSLHKDIWQRSALNLLGWCKRWPCTLISKRNKGQKLSLSRRIWGPHSKWLSHFPILILWLEIALWQRQTWFESKMGHIIHVMVGHPNFPETWCSRCAKENKALS